MNQQKIQEIQRYLFNLLGYKLNKHEIIGLADCESIDSLKECLLLEFNINELDYNEIEELYLMLC